MLMGKREVLWFIYLRNSQWGQVIVLEATIETQRWVKLYPSFSQEDHVYVYRKTHLL